MVSGTLEKAYQVHLLSVLLLSDLRGAFLVLVGSHNLLLQLFELVGLGADTLDLLALTFVLDLEFGHLSRELVLNSRLLRGLKLLSQCHLKLNY